ncbi:hypothetical protein ACX0G7_12360 [Flavitalea antarctica]
MNRLPNAPVFDDKLNGLTMNLMMVTVFLLAIFSGTGQTVASSLPLNINDSQRYLFYLHGGVVTELGNNAINSSAPEWGPYEYANILDSLKNEGYHVISEIRKKGLDNEFYVDKVAHQVDSLLRKQVPTDNIILLGASSGWDIVLRVASKLKNHDLNFVMMGGCWPDTHKDYSAMELYGNFLSIIEKTDTHKTCNMIFSKRKSIKSFKEIELNTGLSHGFFYKGRRVWIEPIIAWAKTSPKS